jgi:uncharacterized protein
MDTLLTHFIRALRNAQVRIATSETLDAMRAVELVGYSDRALLKTTLGLVLPKTLEDKTAFDTCFDKFFAVGEAGNIGADRAIPSRDYEQDRVSDDSAPGSPAAAGDDDGQGLPGAESSLGQMLMRGDRAEVGAAVGSAGQSVDVQNIQIFTQKAVYTRKVMQAMGLEALTEEIQRLRQSERADRQRLAGELGRRRDWLRERVRDYIEHQFLLHADVTGKRLREELLRTVRLANADQRSLAVMRQMVRKIAKQLAALYSRRRRVFRRGQLHVPRTLRANAGFDGAIFDLRWRSAKADRPKVLVLCDVSGSVSEYARFMLMLLYSLEEVLPNIRSFAFSAELGEVSDYFAAHPVDDAIARILLAQGGGSTDYGRALEQFAASCLDDVDRRTSIIVLGDARNNFGVARAEILKSLYERCKRLIWLNPESTVTWDSGDSIMSQYAPYCHQVEECGTLAQLERVVSRLLRHAS